MHLTLASSFNVTSPNFPKPYPRTIDCYWTVTTSGKGTIIVNFLIFGVDLGREQFVVVSNTTTADEDKTLVAWFTGSLVPRSMLIPHSEMHLMWYANVWNTEEQIGFVIEISLAQSNSKYKNQNYTPFMKDFPCLLAQKSNLLLQGKHIKKERPNLWVRW